MQLPETCRIGVGLCLSARGRRNLRCVPIIVGALGCAVLPAIAQTDSWSARLASALIAPSADGGKTAGPTNTWDEQTGLELEALDAAWYNTAKGDDFRYVQRTVDATLSAGAAGVDGSISLPTINDPSLARQLLFLYRVTRAPKYYEAASAMHDRLAQSCNVSSVPSEPAYPNAEKALALCQSQAFLAEYAAEFHRAQDFAAITQSFDEWNERINRSSRASRTTATPGDLSEIALFSLALVDSLPNYPQDDPGRAELIAQLNRLASNFVQHQNRQTGLFEEAASGHSSSASCLLVYALERGVRLGYLPERYTSPAQRAWQAILQDANPADRGRSKQLGPLLLAATEADLASMATQARGETVMLDAWYNSQQRKNAAGQVDSFHYKWSDWSDSGYSLLGHIFRSYGIATETLGSAPTPENLHTAQFYIIVSPDIPAKNPNPHYMTEQDAGGIAAWVKNGGVLVLMENDPPNADIDHLNLLADRFGIHFDNVLHHHIIGEQVEDGRIPVSADGTLFHRPHTLYMKDTCALTLRTPAIPLLRDRGDVMMSAARYGRGIVFAAVDPWLYNEYTDGRKNPLIYDQFDNFAGGEEFVQWLLQQQQRLR